MYRHRMSSVIAANALIALGCSSNAEPPRPVRLYAMESEQVVTDRLTTHIVAQGSDDKEAVVFLHGALSGTSSWSRVMAGYGPDHFLLAIDMRGFGDTETKPVDATKGVMELSEDVRALLKAKNITRKIHLVGHSMGALVALQYVVANPATVASLILVAPPSLFGIGGTKGASGTPNYADFSGTGAGGFPSAAVDALLAKDRTASSPFTVRNFLRTFLVSTDFQLNAEFEEALIDDALKAALGDDNFPGKTTRSQNWPYFGPGTNGIANAVSSKYYAGVAAAFVALPAKPPVLWIRSSLDLLTADEGAMDIANFGINGTIPNYPGQSVYPFQPQITQTRTVLTNYAAAGGHFEERVYPGKGHAPYLYAPELFIADVKAFVSANSGSTAR
jgi:pimeloyl-ACP methyl ester carboxylesterase